MARIVVRIPNWLGDAVMSTCALSLFRSQHPGDEIALFGMPGPLAVFQSSPDGFELLPYDRQGEHKGMIGFLRSVRSLRAKRFEKAFLLTNSFSSALLFYAAGIKERIGYGIHGRAPLLTQALLPDKNAHQAERYARIFNIAIPQKLQPRIFISDEEQGKTIDFLKRENLWRQPWIGLAAGSANGAAKRWPAFRYAELAQECNHLGIRSVLFGAPEERNLAEEIAVQAGQGIVNLAGRASLREFFALLQQCPLLIANDSGAMHAAAALGTPLIAIFGPTDPKQTAPLGESCRIVRKEMECSPCCKKECPLKHHRCMTDITTKEILDIVKRDLDVIMDNRSNFL